LQEWAASPRRGSKAIWDILCRLLAGRRTTIVAASGREAEAARKRFPRIPVKIVENGVAVPERVTHRESAVFRILFLGRLHVIKGIENLIEACKLLKGRGDDFRLRIVGPSEPGYLESLKEQARRSGLGNTIEFLGPVDESVKEALFAESDVLVLPSFSENFGLVVAESLAHGVPVIVSDKTPWRSVEERGCGRWVPNDAKSLADAIQSMMAAERKTMGQRGREWMCAEFSWEQKTSQLLRVYEEAQNAR
jgi:glycosyltransferase involved in cell wall biosynthesis